LTGEPANVRQTRVVTLCNGSERSIAPEELWGRFQGLFDPKSQAPFAGLADPCRVLEEMVTAFPSIAVLPDLETNEPYAVYFTLTDGSAVKVSRPSLDSAAMACISCGSRAWWRSIHGAVVCGRCHPPVSAAVVAEWLGGQDA
jgi:hypothetical protein